MTFAGLIDRLDDRVNPIVVKELRQAVKSRVIAILLVSFLFLQLFIVGAKVLLGEARSFGGEADWVAGRDLFPWLQGVLVIALVLMVPAYGCIRMTAERSDQNVDLLFISTLKPHSIMAGKFFATLVLGGLIISACAPFLTFCYLLRGLDMATILFLLLVDVLALLVATMSMMLLASAPGGLVMKAVLLVLGYMFFLLPACYLTIGFTTEFLWRGTEATDNAEFWLATAAVSGAVLSGVGLMFVYSVAQVSPSASNRVLPNRIYLLLLWVVSVVAMAFACKYATSHVWTLILKTWLFSMGIMFAMQAMISVCERDQYGPRLRRQIPSNPLLRVPAFFLFTGSANGLAFTLPLIAASLALGFYWQDASASTFTSIGTEHLILTQVLMILALYGYCYAMSAVLARVYLLGGQLRSGMTWLIAGLLIGLGSAVPPSIAFILFKDQMRPGTDHMWYKLPNPFLSVVEAVTEFPNGRINWDYYEPCMWFLAIWAVLMTALATPWFWRQLAAFAPRRRAEVPLAELAEPAKETPTEVPNAPQDAVMPPPAGVRT